MLKLMTLLGVIAALTLANPSNSVAQGWDGGGGGVTVSIGNLLGFHLGFPFPNRRLDFEERGERRFFPTRVDCCEEHQDFCCEERRFFPRREFEESRSFPRPFSRPPYYYGDYPAYRGGPRPYEYQARPAHDYDAAPRPPADIRGGYYNAGYVQ